MQCMWNSLEKKKQGNIICENEAWTKEQIFIEWIVSSVFGNS